MTKITFKTVPYNSVKIVLKKPCINRESNNRRSQFSYTVIVVTRT